jgi:hypothetical protein
MTQLCGSLSIYQVFIDGNGDAEGNYTVVALLDDESVNGSLRMSMQTVAYFQYTPNASSNPHDLPVSLFIGLILYPLRPELCYRSFSIHSCTN